MPDSPVSATQKVLTVQASAMFMAILDFVLDNPEPRISPKITALAVTSDGFLMSWDTDRPHKEGLVGHISDFERNLHGVCQHAGLTSDEISEAEALAWTHITDWRISNRKGISPYAAASR